MLSRQDLSTKLLKLVDTDYTHFKLPWITRTIDEIVASALFNVAFTGNVHLGLYKNTLSAWTPDVLHQYVISQLKTISESTFTFTTLPTIFMRHPSVPGNLYYTTL